jgi:hypothetical protein
MGGYFWLEANFTFRVGSALSTKLVFFTLTDEKFDVVREIPSSRITNLEKSCYIISG